MEWLGVIVLIVSFVGLMAIGTPITYSIGLAALCTLAVSLPFEPSVTTIAQRMGNGINSFGLLAIPFFVLAGHLMNKGGIAIRLIDFAKLFVARLSGGLLYINIIACMLFGAISGSAVAAASAIGGVMLPIMYREKYDKGIAASVNVASSTTGMLIPPSNILIVYSLASGGASIAALFVAGYIPGLLLGLTIAIVVAIQTFGKGYPKADAISFKEAMKVVGGAVWSLSLLVIVIGGILSGIFTATEASAVAVVYTLILSLVIYKDLKVKDLFQVILDSVVTTAVILSLIAASMAMSWAMSFEDIPQQMTNVILSISDNPIIVLLIINAILLFIGVFMDMTPAVLIFTPILLPIVTTLGIDPIHFGIIMVTNLSIGLCTPPVGSVLFVGATVGKIEITKIIRPMIPFFAAMLVSLMLVTFIPELSLWLPKLVGLIE